MMQGFLVFGRFLKGTFGYGKQAFFGKSFWAEFTKKSIAWNKYVPMLRSPTVEVPFDGFLRLGSTTSADTSRDFWSLVSHKCFTAYLQNRYR